MEQTRTPNNGAAGGNTVQYGLSAVFALVLAVATAITMREQGAFAASNYAAVVGLCMSMPWALNWYRSEGRDVGVFLSAINRAVVASAVLGAASAWLLNLIL